MNNRWYYSLLPLLLFATASNGAATLYQQWQQNRHSNFSIPLQSDYRLAIELFDQLLQGVEPTKSQRERWRAIGISIQSWGDYWLLMDDPERPSGHGFYVICKQCNSALVLQAPHGDSDLNTAKITLALLALGGVAAVALNSAPRTLDDGMVKSDLAKLNGTLFNAFSAAVAHQKQLTRVVQLHGFNQKRRQSRVAASADIILSNGTRLSSPSLRELQSCLADHLGVVLAYPQQVKELGGRRNQQGILLRSAGFKGFIHLEMAYPLRQRLALSGDAQRALHRCLVGGTT
ncbi:MAG: hypothetical protein L3J62_03275 [Gammaproteobacteria bacterium]|nr:hypothetical protein [Gammaproteobacteria bacterium]MCF6229808.1 hypothetical protein [Gammaproteobacteria bacterium]